jgi:uncharacterized membrane protein
METPASIRKHPLHPMLIAFPVGLWIFSLICDGISFWIGDPEWHVVAFYTMVGGLIGGLLAAIPGAIDLYSLKEARPKRIGLAHMAINIVVMTMYAINIGLRVTDEDAPTSFSIWLSVIAVILLLISGWLGGELVHVLHIGVADNIENSRRGQMTGMSDMSSSKRNSESGFDWKSK